MVLPGVKIFFLKDQTLNLKENNLFWVAVKTTTLLFHKMFSSDLQNTKKYFSVSLCIYHSSKSLFVEKK